MTQLKPGSNYHNLYLRMIKKLFLLLVLFFISISAAGAADWFVSQEGAGEKDGTAQKTAWDGFDSINWDVINPGDTLFVCGFFGDGSLATRNGLRIGKSGTQGNPITVDGNCPNDPGVIYSAFKIEANQWTAIGNGLYKSEYKNLTQRLVENDLTYLAGKDLDTVKATPGTYYVNSQTKDITYHPSKAGQPQTVWYNAGAGVDTGGKSWVVIQNLTLRMSGTAHGGVMFTNDGEYGPPSSHVVIRNNKISHGALSGILLRSKRYNVPANKSKTVATDIVIQNNEIYNSGEGFLYEGSNDKYAAQVRILNNYFHDMDQYDQWSDEDSHCIWVQHADDWVIRGNRFERICNAIALWKGPSSRITNVLIEHNLFKDVENIGGGKVGAGNQTFTIRIGGGNSASKEGVKFGSGYENLVIRYNLFVNNHYDCIETKSAYNGDTNPIKIYGNTFIDSGVSLRLYRNPENPGANVEFRNNISLFPKKSNHKGDPGRHLEILWHSNPGEKGFFRFITSNNIYWPDGPALFEYNGNNAVGNYQDYVEANGGESGSSVTDPKLNNAYSPNAGSIAINRGANLGAQHEIGLKPGLVWYETLKQSDYGNWDIGAFVYNGNAPVPVPVPATNKPSAPQNLNVITGQ